MDSAGYDKLNNFVGQIQDYDYLIVSAPLSQVTRVERYCRIIYSELYGYPYLNHIIQLWPWGWVKQIEKLMKWLV